MYSVYVNQECPVINTNEDSKFGLVNEDNRHMNYRLMGQVYGICRT
jgi:hypothetical protein